jgi:DNA-binding transcriptional LysR family regulator
VLKKGQGFRQITEELCLSAGFQPRIVFESSNIDTVQSLVAAGMGIAFVPSMVARMQGSPFTPSYLPLYDKPHRTLVIAYRKGRYLSRAAEVFITTLLEVISD